MEAVCIEGGILQIGGTTCFVETGDSVEYSMGDIKTHCVSYEAKQEGNIVTSGTCKFKLMFNRRFEKVKDAPKDTILPERKTKYSAGYDFFAPRDIVVPANGFSKMVPLNIKAYMMDNEFLGLYIRSSLATKEKNGYLQISQGTAIIDSDYVDNPDNNGNIGVVIQNRSNEDKVIKKGDRFCQGIFQKYYITDDDNAKGERVGGFGSTNK